MIEILKPDTIKVSYIDRNGFTQQTTVEINDKLEQLNPENLDS